MDTSLIPKPQNKEHLLHHDGDTMDIVRSILKWDGRDDKAFCKFAKQFKPNENGLFELWKFVKYQISYEEDQDGQVIQSPRALWDSGVGDCKSKTLFVNQVLRCLGIPYIIRFTSYGTNSPYTHVYSIAVLNGKQIILDTVYYYFNSEKPYHHKKDYQSSMVKITAISGLSSSRVDVDIQAEVQKKLRDIREKQSYVPPAEFIPYSRLTTGQANTEILRQRLQIKKAMEPQFTKEYNEALKLVEKQLVQKDFHRSKNISGVGSISDAVQPIARLITHYYAQEQPAMYAKRRSVQEKIKGWENVQGGGRKYVKADGSVYNFAANPFNDANCAVYMMSYPNMASQARNIMMRLNSSPSEPTKEHSARYVYARNSIYAKSFFSTVKIVDANGNTVNSTFGVELAKLIKKHFVTGLRDGNSVIRECVSVPMPPPAPAQQICFDRTDMDGIYIDLGGPGYNNPLYSPTQRFTLAQLDAVINGVITTGQAGATAYSNGFSTSKLVFMHEEFRSKFLEEVRIMSGIPDEYINDIFTNNPDCGLGNGFMYAYCRDVKNNQGQNVSLNAYPQAVIAKYGKHAGYVSGCATFCGIDDSIVKNLGRANVAFNQDGKEPEQQLKSLLTSSGASIGLAPGVLEAIVGIISAVLAFLGPIITAALNKAETVEPGNIPQDFKPITGGLQFDETDWEAGSGGGGGNNNTNTDGGGGGGNNGEEEGSSMLPWLLLGGGAAWGLYEYSKSSKKSQ